MTNPYSQLYFLTFFFSQHIFIETFILSFFDLNRGMNNVAEISCGSMIRQISPSITSKHVAAYISVPRLTD